MSSGMNELNDIKEECNFKISRKRTKIIAFHKKFPIQGKVLIYDKIIEKVSGLNYQSYVI